MKSKGGWVYKSLVLNLTLLISVTFALNGSQVTEKKFSACAGQRENKPLLQARPGQVVLIGTIPPPQTGISLPEVAEREISIELEEEAPPQEEERELLRQRLVELQKERQVLSGDFYGINQYGYRYSLIFDRLGYIRYRLNKIDQEIKRIRQLLAALQTPDSCLP